MLDLGPDHVKGSRGFFKLLKIEYLEQNWLWYLRKSVTFSQNTGVLSRTNGS